MRRELARILPFLAFMVLLYGGQWVLNIHFPRHLGVAVVIVYTVVALGVLAAGTVVHELGHALAVRLVGGQVTGVQLGGKTGRRRWILHGVPVTVGLGFGGHVRYQGGLSAPRRAAVLAAGPATSVLFAPLCLLLPFPHGETEYLVLFALASGLEDLLPGRTGDGRTTDGAKLWQTRAMMRSRKEVRALMADPGWPGRPEAAGVLINGLRLEVPEAEGWLDETSSQPGPLLRLFHNPWPLPDQPDGDFLHFVHLLTWKVLITGDLPGATADLAADRLEWVIGHLDAGDPHWRLPLYDVQHTLAVARLRQSRAADARPLCAAALAADLEPRERASVLATVAMARHAGLLSSRPQLDEALTLDPDAPLVSEAARFTGGGWDTALARQPT